MTRSRCTCGHETRREWFDRPGDAATAYANSPAGVTKVLIDLGPPAVIKAAEGDTDAPDILAYLKGERL